MLKAGGVIRGGWEVMSKQERWWMSLAKSAVTTSAHRSLLPFLRPSSLHPFFFPSIHASSQCAERSFFSCYCKWQISPDSSLRAFQLKWKHLVRERGRSQKIWVRERWKWEGRGKEREGSIFSCMCACIASVSFWHKLIWVLYLNIK